MMNQPYLRAAALTLTMFAACGTGRLAAQQSLAIVGDTAAGHAYAAKHCAQCHAIEAGAKSSLVIAAPPFATMVKHKKLTTTTLEGWLRASHSAMRTTTLSAETRADLIAYIKSLALK